MERARFDGLHSCCFTGHRPPFLPDGGDETRPGMLRLKALLDRTVLEAAASGVRTFLAGGAPGFDTIAAEAVLALKADFPDVRLLLALPSHTQSDEYPDALKTRYERILSQASAAYYASEISNAPAAMRRRNRFLVDHSDCCIAYLTQRGSGTSYTVDYAKKRGRYVVNLAGAGMEE